MLEGVGLDSSESIPSNVQGIVSGVLRAKLWYGTVVQLATVNFSAVTDALIFQWTRMGTLHEVQHERHQQPTRQLVQCSHFGFVRKLSRWRWMFWVRFLELFETRRRHSLLSSKSRATGSNLITEARQKANQFFSFPRLKMHQVDLIPICDHPGTEFLCCVCTVK